MNNYSLGIDVGYSAVKAVIINSKQKVAFVYYEMHKGKIKHSVDVALEKIRNQFDVEDIAYGALTGSVLRQGLYGDTLFHRVNEVSAAIEGCIYLNPCVKSIIEIGGQSAKYITGFNTVEDYALRISKRNMLQIATNSDCAAGTGSFLEEQADRLNIGIEEYSSLVEKAHSIPRIAGRCSVFAKTDIVHHQQEGVPPGDILKGVAYAIVRNYKGAVIRKLPIVAPVFFIGGVAKNQAVVDALRDVLKKNESQLVVPQYYDSVAAIGAALIAQKEKYPLGAGKLMHKPFSLEHESLPKKGSIKMAPLNQIKMEDISQKHKLVPVKGSSQEQRCFLGIDIGSTSTNLVLLNPEKEIIAFKYIRTKGNPLEAVKKGTDELRSQFNGKLDIAGVGITGSGRSHIGQQLGADIIRDEITAQAKAAVHMDPNVDTVFEIGGQDSKYISLNKGRVSDFQMNKVCAAGTGSFLDEQASEFNITVEELAQLAIKGKGPVPLDERCTVFIKSSIASSVSRGDKTEDILAGLCYSIAKNYLHRVVGNRKIGNSIMLQGGIAFNQGVANALRILTAKKISTTPFFSVTGAYGVALLACENMKGKQTSFIGIDTLVSLKVPLAIARQQKDKEVGQGEFQRKIEKTIFKDYKGFNDPAKKTVGVPRALFTYGMFPMFNAIFDSLDCNVLLSGWSDEETIRLGQEYAMEETCFPVKLILGHVAELISKKVDYIFFPDLYSIDHPGSESRKNFGCAYMQLAFKIVNHTMDLETKGIKLLAPTIAFSMGGNFMQKSFLGLGKTLGKSEEETRKALQKGMGAYHRFEERMEANGRITMKNLDPNKITFVIISKTYGVADPVLNLGIPQKLINMGFQVVPFFDLPEGVDINKEHPNMFWPFGQHILEPAYFIKEYPNMYPILLTHHGCGPDSVLLHFFKEIIGDKPYLNIEIDEHASKIGVSTRIEAFINSLKVNTGNAKLPVDSYIERVKYKDVNIRSSLGQLKPGKKLFIPNLYPYSELFKELLQQYGHNVEILETGSDTIDLGRKHTLTNEYFSLTSLLGGCIKVFKQSQGKENFAFLVPQTEGAEVEGQYNRLLRTKLDEFKKEGVEIISPFLEDAIAINESDFMRLFCCILAGDVTSNAPLDKRAKILAEIKQLICGKQLNIANLKKTARNVYQENKGHTFRKRILAIGEPMIVFNDYLNQNIYKTIEEQGDKVVYASLSEAMWLFWQDYIVQNKPSDPKLNVKLNKARLAIESISGALKDEGPFTRNIIDLKEKADSTIGYYAGGFARYRQAKVLCSPVNTDGIITAASLYENTGVSLNILHKGFSDQSTKPVLNLTFDGNSNEKDRNKVESFIYYL